MTYKKGTVMENKHILLLRHHPMNVYFTNTFYTSQTENDLSEYTVIDVTSRITRNKEFMEEHPRFAREISPFYVGPVTSSDGVKAEIFEIFWPFALSIASFPTYIFSAFLLC